MSKDSKINKKCQQVSNYSQLMLLQDRKTFITAQPSHQNYLVTRVTRRSCQTASAETIRKASNVKA